MHVDVVAEIPAVAGRATSAGLRPRFARRLLAGCLLVVLGASWLASRIQDAGGHVQVTGLTMPAHNGQWIAADLYRPRTATENSPAPLVVVVPGFQRSKETLGNVSLELARRGIVVIAIDPYAQGNSSSSTSPRSATTEGYGAFAIIDYAAGTGNLNYVDKSRLGVTGHSAGGNAAIQAASHFGRQAGRSGKPSKVHSAFVSGYVLSLTDKVLETVRSNVGMSYALYDEGAYRNELKHGAMRRAPEALRLVRSGRPPTEPALEELEIGRYYGTAEDRTLRVVHNEPLLHPLQPYSPEATANQVEFFARAFGLSGPPAPGDQVWHWKELLTLLSLAAAFVALVPLAQLLLAAVPYFGALVHPVPPAFPALRGGGQAVHWGLLALGALVACFSYIPMAELSQKLFVEASGREQTWFFPQRMNNAVMLWALLNGAVGFLLFFVGARLHGRRDDDPPHAWGTSTTPRELARTFLFALVLAVAFFLLLFTVYYFFHVDYRFLFVGARPFQPVLLVLLLMYAPMFFPFFLSNSLRVNGGLRREGDPEWRSMLIAGLANSLGLFLIVVIQYATFAMTGTVHWTDGWLYVNLLFAVVPIMFVLPYFQRYFFRMTGRVYLGPMTMCLVFVMILISNTVCYVPI
jgi:hypothetical protein